MCLDMDLIRVQTWKTTCPDTNLIGHGKIILHTTDVNQQCQLMPQKQIIQFLRYDGTNQYSKKQIQSELQIQQNAISASRSALKKNQVDAAAPDLSRGRFSMLS